MVRCCCPSCPGGWSWSVCLWMGRHRRLLPSHLSPIHTSACYQWFMFAETCKHGSLDMQSQRSYAVCCILPLCGIRSFLHVCLLHFCPLWQSAAAAIVTGGLRCCFMHRLTVGFTGFSCGCSAQALRAPGRGCRDSFPAAFPLARVSALVSLDAGCDTTTTACGVHSVHSHPTKVSCDAVGAR